MIDFDKMIDRRNTNSVKWDFFAENNKPEDTLPLWVADMDFRVPDEVTRAIQSVAEHGVYGYSAAKADYFEALRAWFSARLGYEPKAEWLIKTPGVVFSLCTSVRAFTRKGDAVMIQRPVYSPFTDSILANERRLVNNALVYKEGRYTIDFQDFERKIAENEVKLFILCSPHNPVGRVWTRDELSAMGNICAKYNVIVVSDEIHCDFTYGEHRHTVFSTVAPEFQERSVICTAPSKTFNIAGLQASNIFIANESLRQEFAREMAKTGYGGLNTMALAACQSAYLHGGVWLDNLREYLVGNIELTRAFLRDKLPSIRLVEPEGTYLLWLDFSRAGLNSGELDDLISNKAKLWLNSGEIFGSEGAGFMRVNIACPRETLAQALTRLASAFAGRDQ